MSNETKFLTAELRRENDAWKLGPDCPKEGLMAHALFDHLVYSNEVEALTPEDAERKKGLEIRKEQIQDEINDDTQGLKTSLQQQLEQIEEELSEFDNKHDVYDIIPTNEEYYSYMDIFELDWSPGDKYAVGTEQDTKWSAEEYAKEIINSEGLNFFSKNFLENYISDSEVADYARDMFNDMVYQDPESWLDESQRETSRNQDQEIEVLNYKISRVNQEIEKLGQLADKSPKSVKDRINSKIEQLESDIEKFQMDISEIEENPDGDFPDELIEEKIDDLVGEAEYDSLSFLNNWDIEINNFINEDDLIEGWIDSDGVEIMSMYDGSVHEENVMGTYYSIIRVE